MEIKKGDKFLCIKDVVMVDNEVTYYIGEGDNLHEWDLDDDKFYEHFKPLKDLEEFDVVNKPKHYQLFPEHNIEVIDVIDKLVEKASSILTPIECTYYSHLMGYLMRFSEKNGIEDLQKARFYLNRIIEKQKLK